MRKTNKMPTETHKPFLHKKINITFHNAKFSM